MTTSRTFTTMVSLESYVNKQIEIAVKNASEIIMNKLRECVEEQYYNDPSFYPNVYERVYQLLNSAAYKILSSNSSEILIDTDSMHYYNGFDPNLVVEYASKSQHGSERYQTNTVDFWSTFLTWADANVINILKAELAKVL